MSTWQYWECSTTDLHTYTLLYICINPLTQISLSSVFPHQEDHELCYELCSKYGLDQLAAEPLWELTKFFSQEYHELCYELSSKYGLDQLAAEPLWELTKCFSQEYHELCYELCSKYGPH